MPSSSVRPSVRPPVRWLAFGSVGRSVGPTFGGDIFTAVAFLIGNGLSSDDRGRNPRVRSMKPPSPPPPQWTLFIAHEIQSPLPPSRPRSKQQQPQHHHHRCPSHGRTEGVAPVRVLDKLAAFKQREQRARWEHEHESIFPWQSSHVLDQNGKLRGRWPQRE